jgi:hypothetical protein
MYNIDNVNESVGDQGLQYELAVYAAIIKAKVPGLSPGDKPTAGYSNQGAGDIEATYNGQPFNIEIKLNAKAQMGGGQLIYDRASETITPHPNMMAKVDPADVEMILDAAKAKISAVNAYIDELMFRGVDAQGFPQGGISTKIRDSMTKDGLSRAVNTVVKGSTRAAWWSTAAQVPPVGQRRALIPCGLPVLGRPGPRSESVPCGTAREARSGALPSPCHCAP